MESVTAVWLKKRRGTRKAVLAVCLPVGSVGLKRRLLRGGRTGRDRGCRRPMRLERAAFKARRDCGPSAPCEPRAPLCWAWKPDSSALRVAAAVIFCFPWFSFFFFLVCNLELLTHIKKKNRKYFPGMQSRRVSKGSILN